MQLPSSNILVTGGAGFIGSHVVDALLKNGHSVIVVDDLSTGKRENVDDGAIFYQSDVGNRETLREIFSRHRIDYCIHEAAKINLNVLLEYPLKDVSTSVIGTLNLLQCCVDFHVKKFIYASSVAVYGRPQKLPAAEDDPCIPVYSYGVAKRCAEEYVRYYGETYGVKYSILRYANVYGPRQPIYGEVGVMAIFADRIARKEPLIVYGDGTQQRDYIYVDDVVDLTIAALTAGDQQTINIGRGQGVTVNELVAEFEQANGAPLVLQKQPERVGELGKFYVSTERLAKIFGKDSMITMQEGIRRTLLFCRANLSRSDSAEVKLRLVKPGDQKLIFQWRNSPFLIQRGSSGRTVQWEEHSTWFQTILNHPQSRLFIIEYNTIPVGQVRFDISGRHTYTITIYIEEGYIGKKIGTQALRAGIECMESMHFGNTYIAIMKEDNHSSQFVFRKIGFIPFVDAKQIPLGYIGMRYSPHLDDDTVATKQIVPL